MLIQALAAKVEIVQSSLDSPPTHTMASLASLFAPRALPSSRRVVSNATSSVPAQSIKSVKQAAQLKLKAQRSLATSYTFKHRGQSFTLLRSIRTRSLHCHWASDPSLPLVIALRSGKVKYNLNFTPYASQRW